MHSVLYFAVYCLHLLVQFSASTRATKAADPTLAVTRGACQPHLSEADPAGLDWHTCEHHVVTLYVPHDLINHLGPE